MYENIGKTGTLCHATSLSGLGATLLLALLTVGCTYRVGSLTLVSTKNIGQLSQKGDIVVGEDCGNSLLGIPIGHRVNAKTAVDRALLNAKGDMMADGVFSRYEVNLILYTHVCYRLEGRVTRGEFAKKQNLP
jgi:hypothetical protein